MSCSRICGLLTMISKNFLGLVLIKNLVINCRRTIVTRVQRFHNRKNLQTYPIKETALENFPSI